MSDDYVAAPRRKQIDLKPTEYEVDVPNKREPFWGSGAMETGLQVLVYVIVGLAVKYFLKR